MGSVPAPRNSVAVVIELVGDVVVDHRDVPFAERPYVIPFGLPDGAENSLVCHVRGSSPANSNEVTEPSTRSVADQQMNVVG